MIARRRRSVAQRLVALGEWLGFLRPVADDRGGTEDVCPPGADPVGLSWGQIDPLPPAYRPGRGPRVEVSLDVDHHRAFIEAEGATYEAVRSALVSRAWEVADLEPWSWFVPPQITMADPLPDGRRRAYPWLGSCTIAVGGSA